MPKQQVINYKAKFKPEMSEPAEGEEPVEIEPEFSYEGSVTYNTPEDTSECVQMFGEAPSYDLIWRSIKIDVQNLSRRYRTVEEAQAAVNAYVPGVKRASVAKPKNVTSEDINKAVETGTITKADLEALLASL
jgi:hypothetical protein